MNKKMFLITLIIVISLFTAQPCRAITVTYLSGNIYVETGTNYLSGDISYNNGWPITKSILLDSDLYRNGLGVYGFVNGYTIYGENYPNFTKFHLVSHAQSDSGLTGIDFYTYALVRSGENPDDMIELELTPDPGEENKQIQLSIEAILLGTINSSGLTLIDPALESGTATVSYLFEIYKDPTEEPLIRLSYSNEIKNEAPTQMITKSAAMPGSLGHIDTCAFMAGDPVYIYFEQVVQAITSGDQFSAASAFLIQSMNKIRFNIID